MKNEKIPQIAFPSISSFDINPVNEKFVSLKEAGFKVEPMYYLQGIAGAYRDAYLRETPANMLRKANDLLPDGLSIKVYDGYRPICVQKRLWQFYRMQVINSHKGENLTDAEIDFKTSFFVSKPSYDVKQPSLHNTGGAVDVTIIDANGKELNMGTAFDDFSEKAWTNHFEDYAVDEEVRDNRRLLYWTMLEAGFTNLPSEWWHYDYGTKFWGYFTGQAALYEGVLDIDFPDRFPFI